MLSLLSVHVCHCHIKVPCESRIIDFILFGSYYAIHLVAQADQGNKYAVPFDILDYYYLGHFLLDI